MPRAGLRSNLDKMTKRISKRMPLKAVVTAEWLQAIQELFWALAEGENVRSGINIQKRSGPGFLLLSGQQGGQDEILPVRTPFEVFVSGSDGDPTDPTIFLRVASDSWLSKSIAQDDYQPITGLDSDFDINLGEKIWLELAIDNTRKITSAKINHGKVGKGSKTWENFPEGTQFDDKSNPNRIQTGCNQLLAYVDDLPTGTKDPIRNGVSVGLSGSPGILVQCVYDHLRACVSCDERNGLTVLGLVPWFAPYVANDDQDSSSSPGSGGIGGLTGGGAQGSGGL